MQKQVFVPVILLIVAIIVSSGLKYRFHNGGNASQKIFDPCPHRRL